jgi:membrane associated rhomboid family serine protease
MIPIRDHLKAPIFPIINNLLIFINILVFLYTSTLSFNEYEAFIYNYAVIPSLIIQGKELFTIFTAMFLHGGLLHLFSNMLFLNIFGDNLEYAYGHFFYLIFYLISGLGAFVLQVLVDPVSQIPNLGASGAIAGLLGGYLVLFPNHRVDILIPFGYLIRTATLPAFTMLIYWIVFQVILGIGSLASPQVGGVAYFAHIGGFLVGLFLTLILKPFLRK